MWCVSQDGSWMGEVVKKSTYAVLAYGTAQEKTSANRVFPWHGPVPEILKKRYFT
jgi:hypothetical protein